LTATGLGSPNEANDAGVCGEPQATSSITGIDAIRTAATNRFLSPAFIFLLPKKKPKSSKACKVKTPPDQEAASETSLEPLRLSIKFRTDVPWNFPFNVYIPMVTLEKR
jgi:hypothetical protein